MADPASEALVSQVATEIMAYLTRYPQAGDTASGIQQWWLASTRDHATREVVEIALARLVAAGRIGSRVLASGERLYFGERENPGSRA